MRSVSSETVSPDSLCQLEILGHDCHSLGVDGTQVGVLEKRHKVCLCCFLESKDGLTLESHFLLKFGGDLSH